MQSICAVNSGTQNKSEFINVYYKSEDFPSLKRDVYMSVKDIKTLILKPWVVGSFLTSPANRSTKMVVTLILKIYYPWCTLAAVKMFTGLPVSDSMNWD